MKYGAVVILCVLLGIGGKVEAQIAHPACAGGPTTCQNGLATCFLRHGILDRCVRLIHNDLIIDFDTQFGGAPLDWYTSNDVFNSFMSTTPAPGTGFQITFDTGQDPTQAGANGITPFPIARATDGPALQAQYGYYIREELQTGWPSGATSYTVTGFYPDFWASLEAIDDSLPTVSAGVPQSGWLTRYNNFLAKPEGEFYGTGVPIWFSGTSSAAEGIIFVGDQLKGIRHYNTPGISFPWNQRLRRIQEGRIASRFRVSLNESNGNSSGGLIFRAKIATNQSNAHLADALQAEKYLYTVDKSGLVQLLYVNPQGQESVMWQSAPALQAIVNPLVNSTTGVQLELRSNNADLSELQLYVEGQLQAVCPTDCDPAYLTTLNYPLGEYVGLHAAANDGDLVKFADREIFDVGVEVSTTFSALADGSLETETIVRNAAFVTTAHEHFRMNRVAFLNTTQFPDLSWFWNEDAGGAQIDKAICNGAYLQTTLSGGSPHANWTGRANGSLGLYSEPLEATVCSGIGAGQSCMSSQGSHVLIQGPGGIHHYNALPIYNIHSTNPNEPGIFATEIRMRNKWRIHTENYATALPFDFDSDCQSGEVIYRPGNGSFYTRTSSGLPQITTIGTPFSNPIRGDFDGDGKSDLGVINTVLQGQYIDWVIELSSGGTLYQPTWGFPSDHIVVADFNASGRDDFGVYRNGVWYMLLDGVGAQGLSSRVVQVYTWGGAGEMPVPADYDGDGKVDLATWSPVTGVWSALLSQSNTVLTQQWGLPGDVPLPADYFANGSADFGVWRPSNGTWYLRSTGGTIEAIQWGLPGDIPLVGDFNKDGVVDLTVYRGSGIPLWYHNLRNGTTATVQWGLVNDKIPTNRGPAGG